MHTIQSLKICRSGLSLLAKTWALPVILALAALAMPVRSLAQAPTFNTLVTTNKGGQSFQHPSWSAAGDFNGDGKLDTLVTDGSSALRVMLGLGNGAFSPRDVGMPDLAAGNVVDIHPSLVPFLPKFIDGLLSIRAADVNGDGRLDAVAIVGAHINFGPFNFAAILINTGNDANGTPQFAVTYYYSTFTDLRSLTVGDLNGDGQPEFIGGGAHAELHSYLNNGNGTFTALPLFSVVPSAGNPAVGPGVIADLNGDGKGDFAVTSNQAGAIDIFFGNGNGTFQAPVVKSIPAATSIAAADVNGDGKSDLLAGQFGSPNQLRVYLNTGGGSFSAPASYSAGGASFNGWTALATADLNGDGKLDVVMTNSGNNNVGMLPGDGNGTFGTPVLFAVNVTPLDVAAGDFNADGKPDIGTVGFNDNTYGVLTNTTVFAPPVVTVFASGISPVIAWDPIYPAAAISPWQAESKPVPTVGYSDPRWANPHPASVFPLGSHPWEFIAPFDFGANWINAWSDLGSRGPGGQSWTKYSTTVTGEGDFVLQFLADNASWIYIDGELVAFQDWDWQHNSTGRYTIHLSGPGPHELSFIIWDGGGLAGGKFRLETTESFQENNPGEELPPPPPSDTTPPVITAPADITAEATSAAGAIVTFTATANDAVDGAVPLVADPASGSSFPLGTTIVDLGASDAAGNMSFALFNVTVQDTTPPVLTVPTDVIAEATGPGGAAVMYPAATATDAVGVTSITYSQGSGSTFPLGATIVTVTARDAAGNSGTGSFTVTVRDTTAPEIRSLTASPGVLWPPNHRMVPVTLTALVHDAVDASPVTRIVSVSSIELPKPPRTGDDDDGRKLAKNDPDWKITGNLTLDLRAERSGNGGGRVYTITVESKDAAGNVSTGTTTVTVPHDRR